MPQLGRVFISSVFGGMLELRAVAAEAAQLVGLETVLAEHHIAQPGAVRGILQREIEACDTYRAISLAEVEAAPGTGETKPVSPSLTIKSQRRTLMSDNLSILSQSPEPENPYAPPMALDLEPSMAQEPAVVLEYVPFWPRAGARLLDTGVHIGLGLVTGGVVGIIAGVFAAIRGIPFATLWPQIQPAPWMSWISGLVGAILYFVIATAGHGSSLGKLLLGIVTLDENGGPCSWGAAFKRELLYYVDSFFFGLIAYQQMQKSPRQQRLGDEWGDTMVVYRRSAPPRSLRSGLQFTGAIFFAMFADVAAMATPFLVQLAAA